MTNNLPSGIPNGPYANPHVADGVYDARIIGMREGTYGPDHDFYVQVALHLPEPPAIMVTNFYFRKAGSALAERRFEHFCCSVGCSSDTYEFDPDLLIGRKLRVAVHTVQVDVVNGGKPFCDVKTFHSPAASNVNHSITHATAG